MHQNAPFNQPNNAQPNPFNRNQFGGGREMPSTNNKATTIRI